MGFYFGILGFENDTMTTDKAAQKPSMTHDPQTPRKWLWIQCPELNELHSVYRVHRGSPNSGYKWARSVAAVNGAGNLAAD